MALAQLDIRPTSVVWDIGAGSGSVAIEAAQLAHQGVVYAIEPDPADLALIQANAEAFGVPNVRPVAGRAPEVLATLPEPDAIFVGGTGRQVATVLSSASSGSPPAAGWPSTSPPSTAWPPPTRPSRSSRARSGSGTSSRPWDRADGPRPLRGDPPHLPPGRHQVRPSGRLSDPPGAVCAQWPTAIERGRCIRPFSPGEGGRDGRLRGPGGTMSQVFGSEVYSSRQDPSSAPSGHLLPRGEG